MKATLLTAREAAERLGVKLDTLYAYVSRGRIRSVAVAGTRERRYRAEDVELLRAAAPAARSADPEALTPVVASAICLIEAGRLYYRGHDAVALAEQAPLEEVARLLWQTETGPPPGERVASPLARSPIEAGVIARCQIRLAQLSGEDLPALDLTAPGVARTGWRILDELAACIASGARAAGPLHERLAAAWRLQPAGADMVRRCLVLIADHELNASTFVARCVASTAATPYAVVAAALAALSGRRHGGETARAEALFAELAGQPTPMTAMAARLARDERLPAFGHFLYPEGDPRAAALLGALQCAAPEAYPPIAAAAEAGLRLTGQRPNVDFALAAVSAGLGLPAGAGLGLFVLGRTVGWIAHAIEQYQSPVLIRPRARYIGPPPGRDGG
jgi:citrate synthase